MSWLVDNANGLYVWLAVVAAGLVVAWRFNQRVKFLGLAAIPVLLIGLIFLLTRFFVSDSKQLETTLDDRYVEPKIPRRRDGCIGRPGPNQRDDLGRTRAADPHQGEYRSH